MSVCPRLTDAVFTGQWASEFEKLPSRLNGGRKGFTYELRFVGNDFCLDFIVNVQYEFIIHAGNQSLVLETPVGDDQCRLHCERTSGLQKRIEGRMETSDVKLSTVESY